MVAYIQFEEGIGDLEHEDMRVAVVVNNKNTLDGAAHAIILVVVLQTLQPGRDRGVLLGLGLFGTVDRRSAQTQ